MAGARPWTRFVAIGDSFTEGVGDPEPTSPGGLRGWADRVAEVLATTAPDFAYANLAVRGRLLQQVVDGQLDHALALAPDLVSISAGGNDLLRPGSDPDAITQRLENAVVRLGSSGATIVVFAGPDPGRTPVLGRVRGKAAIYNEELRALAARRGALVVDLWAIRTLRDPRMWAPDRLHLSPAGHRTVAGAVLDRLGVAHQLREEQPAPAAPRTRRQTRIDDLSWAREHLMPWVVRRIRGRSSGDSVIAKRPTAGPVQRAE